MKEIWCVIKMSEYAIETEGLSKSYNGFVALKSLGLKIPKN